MIEIKTHIDDVPYHSTGETRMIDALLHFEDVLRAHSAPIPTDWQELFDLIKDHGQ